MLIFVAAIQNNISHPDHDWGGKLHEVHAMLAGYLENDSDLKQFSLVSQEDIPKEPNKKIETCRALDLLCLWMNWWRFKITLWRNCAVISWRWRGYMGLKN